MTKWTPAGEFRHWTVIQLPTETGRAASGQPVTEPVTLENGGGYAAIYPMSGTTLYQAQQLQSGTTHRAVRRWLPGVVPECVIQFGSRTFHIQQILNPEEMNVELHFLCAEKIG